MQNSLEYRGKDINEMYQRVALNINIEMKLSNKAASCNDVTCLMM